MKKDKRKGVSPGPKTKKDAGQAGKAAGFRQPAGLVDPEAGLMDLQAGFVTPDVPLVDPDPVSAREDPVAGKAMALVFCAFIFILAAAFVLLPPREFSAQENRYLAQLPQARWKAIKSAEYMADIEEFIMDQFPARDRWVSLKALCQKAAFQKENNKVYNAAQGYLIGALEPVDQAIVEKNLAAVQAMKRLGDTLTAAAGSRQGEKADQEKGTAEIENVVGPLADGRKAAEKDAASLKTSAESLEGLQPFQTALLLVPTAAEVLRDKLPAYAYLPDQAELLAQAKADLGEAYIDVTPALREMNASGRQVYYRTDHHWVTAAAYQGYAAYLEWLGLTPNPRDAYTEERVSGDFYGTLWSKNSLPAIDPDSIEIYTLDAGEPKVKVTYYDGSSEETGDSLYGPAYLESKDKYAYFLNGNKPLTVIRTGKAEEAGAPAQAFQTGENAAGPAGQQDQKPAEGGFAGNDVLREEPPDPGLRLLVFKDSYAHCLIPFLTPYFEEIHVVDLRYWHKDPVAYMKENRINQVLFLYNAETFASDRTISQVGSYLSRYGSQ
ncbi:MAG: DHHW family protein [Peptococcaceae bacterium]|nr:DHHW family protein [Peptococcaceae bacterium]